MAYSMMSVVWFWFFFPFNSSPNYLISYMRDRLIDYLDPWATSKTNFTLFVILIQYFGNIFLNSHNSTFERFKRKLVLGITFKIIIIILLIFIFIFKQISIWFNPSWRKYSTSANNNIVIFFLLFLNFYWLRWICWSRWVCNWGCWWFCWWFWNSNSEIFLDSLSKDRLNILF